MIYYRSGTGVLCCICARQTLRFHSSGGSTFLREMTSRPPFWNYDVKSKIRLCQSMCVYSRNNPVKFHPDPIWNDGALGGFLKITPTRTAIRRTTTRYSDMRSVPHLKTEESCYWRIGWVLLCVDSSDSTASFNVYFERALFVVVRQCELDVAGDCMLAVADIARVTVHTRDALLARLHMTCACHFKCIYLGVILQGSVVT